MVIYFRQRGLCAGALLAGLLLTPFRSAAPSDAEWEAARLKMVAEEIEREGIEDPRVLEALRQTPRHWFVSERQRHLAYFDMALPIGKGQTISPPFIVAYMTEALELQPDDKVLEIGTGSGYQAAVLSQLAAEVYSIEIVPSLGRKAARTLRRLGYDNVQTKIGDGFRGWQEYAPFDAIMVTCSPERPPQALVDQLAEGGRMVIPVGRRYQQSLVLLKKVNGQLESEPLRPTFFVPMTGRAEELRSKQGESGIPRLLNASFEHTDDEDRLRAWYYVRQAEVVEDGDAIDGQNYLRFTNETPGKHAQALQAVGVNGREIGTLDLSLWIRLSEVQIGQSPRQLPRVDVSFFDEQQRPCGSQSAGPWYGTIDWVKKRETLEVPPTAKLAVVAVGLFGGIGEFSLDHMELRAAQPR